MDSIGRTIQRAREKKQLTQYDLGFLLGKTQQLVNQWEHNKREPNIKDFLKLIIILGIDIDKLKGIVKAIEFDLNKTVEERWVEQRKYIKEKKKRK